MEVPARLRHLKISPRKVRLVTDVVKGMPVIEAEFQLQYLRKAASRPLLKLLQSAIANAENNNELKKENLFIKRFFVDEGPTLKRYRARAFGRAGEIRKRSSHVTIILDEISEKKSTAKKSSTKKAAAKKTTRKDDRPVVDYTEIKHSTKESDKKGAPDQRSGQSAPQSHGAQGAKKESFSRRLGDS